MKKKKANFFTPMVLLLVILVLGYYTYLSNQTKSQPDTTTKSEKDKILEYDFAEDYPRTVRETVKLYCKFSKMAYSGTCSDDELRTINLYMRELLDEELLANNSADKQLQGLKFDVALYAEKKQKFVSYTLEEASLVQYNTEDNVDYAKTKVTFNFTVGMSAASVDQEYLLRKDSKGRWKILGWQEVKPKNKKGDEQ